MVKEKAMSVNIQLSQVINRPVADVFRFFAHEHVRNHPRWDPYIQLEKVSSGPMGVGTVIKRINTRSGKPVEGMMEVVRFEPDREMDMLTHDGPIEIRGRSTFEAVGEDQSILTLHVEIPDMDESMEGMMSGAIQKSLQNIKQLIESEVNE
jgi:hypothetical protein